MYFRRIWKLSEGTFRERRYSQANYKQAEISNTLPTTGLFHNINLTMLDDFPQPPKKSHDF
jgi:hypothetical protein